jgi:hypothetical protein
MATNGTPYGGRDSIIAPSTYKEGLRLRLYTNTLNSLDNNSQVSDLTVPTGEGAGDILLDGEWSSTNGVVTYEKHPDSLALHYDFARTKSLRAVAGRGPELTCTRATTATYVNELGLIATSALNSPRFAHDPVTGESLGLLVEQASTNTCLQSEDFGTTWTPTGNGAINTNQAVSPDGLSTADQLIDDASTGSGTARVEQTITTPTSTAHTFSAFLKADQLDWAWLRLVGMASQSVSAYFDLTNGAVGATLGADNDDQGIEDYGNGWYRCWVSFTSDSVDTSAAYLIYAADADNDNTVDLDGTSSIFVWGAMLETGPVPTTYIPTTTISVSRAADVVETTDVSWYNESALTMYAHASQDIGQNGVSILTPSDGTNNNRWFFIRNSATQIRLIPVAASVSQATQNVTVAGNEFRAVYGYEANDGIMYVNGSASAGDASATMPTGIDSFYVGSNATGLVQQWGGHIKEIRGYNERLPNQQLEDLSNGLGYGDGNHRITNTGASTWTGDPTGAAIIRDDEILHFKDFALGAISMTAGKIIEIDISTFIP